MPRISHFSKMNSEYMDVFNLEDLMEYLTRIKEGDKGEGLIVIDSLGNLLLGCERQKVGLG